MLGCYVRLVTFSEHKRVGKTDSYRYFAGILSVLSKAALLKLELLGKRLTMSWEKQISVVTYYNCEFSNL